MEFYRHGSLCSEIRHLHLYWTCQTWLSLQLPTLGALDALGERPYTRIDGITIILQLLALVPQIFQRYRERLDELIILERRLRVLIFWKREIDSDMDHAQVGIAEPGICEHVRVSGAEKQTNAENRHDQTLSTERSHTVEHDGADAEVSLDDFAHVARLFFQLS